MKKVAINLGFIFFWQFILESRSIKITFKEQLLILNQIVISKMHKNMHEINTPIGKVRKVKFDESVPWGWKLLELSQAKTIKNSLDQLLDEWSIVAVNMGKLEGRGYGSQFHEKHGNECGEKFIVQDNGKKISRKSQVKTQIGTVRRVKFNQQVPRGWRVLELAEAKTIKQSLNQLLDEWSVVSLRTGKLQGTGYGNKFHQTFGGECGQKFLIQDHNKQHEKQPKQQQKTKANNQVKTALGIVRKIQKNLPIPQGWRLLQLHEGKQCKNQLNQLLDEWSVVALNKGKLQGIGYGNKFYDIHGSECGEIFIIQDHSPLKAKNQVKSPIGTVKKIRFDEPVPWGWKMLELSEALNIKESLNQLLDEWSIVALNKGKLEGKGYGNKFHENFGTECGQKFIVQDYGVHTNKIEDKKQKKTQIKTSLGIVKKVNFDYPVPWGWKVLSLSEAKTIKESLNQLLDEYSIVAVDMGKLEGRAYGNQFHQKFGGECGEKFIIQDNGKNNYH